MKLRKLELKDVPLMLEWMHDENVIQWLSFDGKSKNVDDCKQFIENSINDKTNIHLAVCDDDGKYCGTVSLKNINKDTQDAEFAISLRSDSQGKGYGPAAIREILYYAFDKLDLNCIYLMVKKNNINAIKAYERTGFRRIKEDENRYHYEIYNRVKPHVIEFPQYGDERGHLVIAEGESNIPFSIKRCFYIYGSDKDIVRGQHANRESEFVLINVAGTSKVKTDDGKGNIQIYNLDRPHIGVYIPKMVWKDMYDFSNDSVLLCLSSEHYDAKEYIRDYNQFLIECK